MAKIKRSTILTYIDVTPDTEDYALLGVGVITGTINYNPKVLTETNIHEDAASISVESYAPTMPLEITANDADDAFNFLDGLRVARAVLSAAETTIVNVWNYESGGPTAAPAEQQAVSIQVDSFGGEGGTPVKLNVTINYVGDPVPGTFNTSTAAFTPT
jgi:hypothetical protein